MKLDHNKKYKLGGDTYHWDVARWLCFGVKVWSEAEFHFFADRGLVEEIREPLRFGGKVRFDCNGNPTAYELEGCTAADRVLKLFQVTAEEIIE